MALVEVGWALAVQLVDNGDNTSVLRFELTANDYTTAGVCAAAILAALANVTDAVVRKYSLQQIYGESAFAFPASGVQVEDKLSCTVLLEGSSNKKANFKIPAPLASLFTASEGGGANTADLSNAALIAYFDLFTSGNVAFLSDGEVALALVSGKRISAKSNFG